MNWPRKDWIYITFCFWSFIQEKTAIQIRMKNHVEIQAEFCVWLLLSKEGEIYIKECYDYTFCIALLAPF